MGEPIGSLDEDRSAGRWCARCKQHGSHHTDHHGEFVIWLRARGLITSPECIDELAECEDTTDDR